MLELKNCVVATDRLLYTVDNLVVEPGRLYVLIGANGAGKSTLLDAIAFGKAHKGSLTYSGKPLSDLETSERSKIIALVESRFGGADYLSTQEYMDLGRFPHTGLRGRLAPEDHAVVKSVTEELRLNHLLKKSTITLSDGERQRASIARALVQQTPILLLDEPTSFLDYPNKRSILALLKKIAVEQGKIVLLASHDLELCLEFSDVCLVINPRTQKIEQYNSADLNLERLIDLAFEQEI